MLFLNKLQISDFENWYKAASEEGAALLIDKKPDWTSFDVVAKVRNLLKIKKVGHAGTLDPLATGLLIVCCGKATKKIDGFRDMHKTYSGIIKLGAETKTDDAEAEEENIKDVNLTESEVLAASQKFTGTILQTPPMYSARKFEGKRLYKLARKNIEVKIEPSPVEVFSFEILKFESPFITFNIKCEKGTYIRSIARDIGAELGTGGYLYKLRRDAIGEYNVKDAISVDELKNVITDSKLLNN